LSYGIEIYGNTYPTYFNKLVTLNNTSCRQAAATICLRPLQVDNIFVFIHQVAPVPTCWLFKTSATSWPLTFWPWKWCLSHVTWATSVPILVFLGLCSRVTPDERDRRQTGCQTKASLNASAILGVEAWKY